MSNDFHPDPVPNDAGRQTAEQRFEDSNDQYRPWLSVSNATQAVDYYKAAFAAIELERLADDDGAVMVAQLSIDGADFWVQDIATSPASVESTSVRMILTVDDPDIVFTDAVAAGATVIAAMQEEHGWRLGRVADPFGHQWEIGRRLTV